MCTTPPLAVKQPIFALALIVLQSGKSVQKFDVANTLISLFLLSRDEAKRLCQLQSAEKTAERQVLPFHLS